MSRNLDREATEILSADVRSEICRLCNNPGVKTEIDTLLVIYDKNDNDTGLRARVFLYECSEGHIWWDGEGRAKGIHGDDPILFEDHLYRRSAKEVQVPGGVPDPSVRSGFYWRDHVDNDIRDSRVSEALRKADLL